MGLTLSIAIALDDGVQSPSLTFIGPASPGNRGLIRLIDTTMKSNMYHPFVTKSQNQFAKMLQASSTEGDARANAKQHWIK